MAFSFFKDKTENNEDNNLSSIFKKIKLNPKVTPNRSLSHDIPDENMFSSVNSYNDPFTANPVDENRIVQESTASINQQCNPQTPFENRNENLFSEINKPAAGQVPAQSNAQEQATPQALYQIGPKKTYYTYQSEDAYLDEDGRNNNHLYIGPGEPLTKKRKLEPKSGVEAQNEYFEKARAHENKNISTPPSFASTVVKKENEQAVNEPPLMRNSVNTNTAAQSTNPFFFNQASSQVDEEDEKPFTPGVVTNTAFDKKNLFQNVRNTAGSSTLNEQNTQTKPKSRNKLNLWIKIALFFRQLISAFFNYTALGVVFAKTSLRLGPSSPCFMPIAYFAVAFVSAYLAVYLHSYAKSSLCANIVTLILLTALGGKGFTGLGNLLENFSKRKVNTYSIVIMTIIGILLISSTFEHYLEELRPDFSFALSFASIVMLSAFAATTLNYGDNTDPENSFGSISTWQLILSLIFYFAVVLATLDYVVAISMLGIALFSRLVLGQYMYVKGLRASRENVLAVQLITCILLMLDLLFITKSVPVYEGPLLLNIR